ncbi:putative sodium-dependent multivitamin transporter [Schistocerca serialis cubense]|uniref:putative sodium-dependent multivitamin transporter n=1 Tax=Schistocerca serialis cubense TaxID=2023355 RepID=UPI00214E99F5|nr:putative sodium-dependent multivitamin transporter [Schistocerca serialis cubense]
MAGAQLLQYLEMRFGVAARLCASIAFSLQMVLYMGIVLYAPALAIRATTGLLMPLYVVDTMSGMPGLFVAGIFSGSLSTVSSAVNSLAAVTLEDYFKVRPTAAAMRGICGLCVDGCHMSLFAVYVRYRGHPLAESRSPLVGKLLALVFGLLFLGLAFMAQFLGGMLQASLTIFGAVGGPVLGFFSLGMFLPHANELGAITGLATWLTFSMWVGFGVPRPDAVRLPTRTDGCDFNITATPLPPTQDPSEYFHLYRVSYLWVVVLGFLLTLVVGAVASWVAGIACEGDRSVPPPDPDLFVPPVRRALLGSNSLQLTRVAGDLSNGVGPAADTKTQEEPLNGIDGHHVAPM